jgi:hypothetical protein
MPEVFRRKSRQTDGMKDFRVAGAKIASRRQLSGEQPKVATSAPAYVSIPLECCKVMS